VKYKGEMTVKQSEGETKPVIDYSTQPMPRSGISLWGLASCAVVIVSVLLFFRNWNVIHRIPVNRAEENLSLYTGFLDFWSRAFAGMTLLGCVLGGAGIWQHRRRRTFAYIGLGLNASAIVTLIILQSTGGPQWF